MGIENDKISKSIKITETSETEYNIGRICLLVATGLLPSAIVGLFCWLRQDLIAFSMLVMHWGAMVLVPLVILRRETSLYLSLLGRDAADFVSHWRSALAICVSLVAVASAGYYPMRCATYQWSLCVNVEPMATQFYESMAKRGIVWVVMAGIYFVLVNPVIEELFWRVFLHRELSTAYKLSKEGVLGTAGLKPGYGSTEVESGPQEASNDTVPSHTFAPPLIIALIAILYASYHAVLFVFEGGWILGAEGLIAIGTLGLLLNYLREHKGVFVAILVHLVVDVFALVVLLIEYLLKA